MKNNTKRLGKRGFALSKRTEEIAKRAQRLETLNARIAYIEELTPGGRMLKAIAS